MPILKAPPVPTCFSGPGSGRRCRAGRAWEPAKALNSANLISAQRAASRVRRRQTFRGFEETLKPLRRAMKTLAWVDVLDLMIRALRRPTLSMASTRYLRRKPPMTR